MGVGRSAREMAQKLRALAVLAEDLGSVPSSHTVPHNCLLTPVSGNAKPSFDFCRHCTHVIHLYMQVKHSHAEKIVWFLWRGLIFVSKKKRVSL